MTLGMANAQNFSADQNQPQEPQQNQPLTYNDYTPPTRQAIWSVDYQMGLTTGEARDFVSKYGTRGFSVSGEAFMTDKITLGGSIGWNGFYEKFPRRTYHIGEGSDITGVKSNSIYTLPIMVTGGYYFLPDAFIQPYAKLGVGVVYAETRTDIGYVYVADEEWRFGITPEVGVYVPFGIDSNVGLIAKAKWNVVFYNAHDISTLSYFNFNIGLGFTF